VPNQPNNVLEQLAAHCRTAYVNSRRRYESERTGRPSYFGLEHIARWDGSGGRATADGRDYLPIWPKIARVCLDHQVSPEDLMLAIFSQARGRMPLPTEAMTPAMITHAKTMKSASQMTAITDLRGQDQAFCTLLAVLTQTMGKSTDPLALVSSVIYDVTAPLTALFRYTMAAGYGVEITDQLRSAAMMEYACNQRLYDKAWGLRVPEEIRQGGLR
jgi:hypothetical protein